MVTAAVNAKYSGIKGTRFGAMSGASVRDEKCECHQIFALELI